MSFADVFVRTLAQVGQASLDGLRQRDGAQIKRRRKKAGCTPCAAKEQARQARERARSAIP